MPGAEDATGLDISQNIADLTMNGLKRNAKREDPRNLKSKKRNRSTW